MANSESFVHYPNKHFPIPDLFIVSAVIFTEDGRYLFQLRDDKLGLPLRNHWAFFGGEVDPGETQDQAVLREIKEELTYLPNNCLWFHEAVYILPRHHKNIMRKAYYSIKIEPNDIASMIQCEGADMRLMSVAEILALQRVAPWDVSVVLLHSREEVIYQT
jgi:8-oxo-dGTP pyrophosphatase MutT (NUDIX family)